MAGDIRVGTSGWSYPSGDGTWNGIFYPAKKPRGFDELAFYAEHFDTVEVNSSFYRVPAVKTTTEWARRTPKNFEFSLKLFQKFTHPDMFLRATGKDPSEVDRKDVDYSIESAISMMSSNPIRFLRPTAASHWVTSMSRA